MATRIRLRRVGRRKQASFRIVVSDGAHAPVGRFSEQIGKYNPRTQPSFIEVDEARALYWLRQGALPSDTVRSLFQRTGIMKKLAEGAEPAEGTVTLGDVDGRTVFTPGSRGESPTSAPAGKASPAKKAEAESKPAATAETAEVEPAEVEDSGTGAEEPEAEGATEVEAKKGADEAEPASEGARDADDDDAAEPEEAAEKES